LFTRPSLHEVLNHFGFFLKFEETPLSKFTHLIDEAIHIKSNHLVNKLQDDHCLGSSSTLTHQTRRLLDFVRREADPVELVFLMIDVDVS
jgi:hypothetical protein